MFSILNLHKATNFWIATEKKNIQVYHMMNCWKLFPEYIDFPAAGEKVRKKYT